LSRLLSFLEDEAMVTRAGYVTTEDGVRLFFESAGIGSQTVLVPNGIHLLDDFEYLAEERTVVFWLEHILPSIQQLNLTVEELALVKTPVLIVHGTKDRSAPDGGGREWALILPNARLVTVEDAAHAPWIEAPEQVFGSIMAFVDGAWPVAAQKVKALDPKDPSLAP
jgi:pimeloyl-ACP methyl ester carboxylesterase